ncbi:31929_t:CDS:2, partial [Gigaspora margarita]
FANQSKTSKKLQTLVEDNYPTIYVIRVKGQRKYYYVYKILSLGFYPLVVQKTQCNSINGTIYQIPDNYSVSLTLFEMPIKCKTQYQSNGLLGKEKYNSNISEVALFGFDLDCLEKKWDQLKNFNNSLLMNQWKPLKELSLSQFNRQIKLLAIDIKNNTQSLF